MSSADSTGRSISDPDLVLIFDLDGTILSVNSFQSWVRYLLTGRFGLGTIDRALLTLRAAAVMARRKLMGLGHLETKRRLQMLWSHAVARESPPLAETGLLNVLNRQIRPGLEGVLSELRHGKAAAVLATAAAADYALPFARHMGFLHALATPRHDAITPQAENLGDSKRETTLDFLKEQNWHERRRVFFTDHVDDLPLIKVSNLVLWFGSDEGLEEAIRLAPGIRILPCRNWTAEQMLAEIDGLITT
jgi:phosphoserine phosphatase